MSESKNYYYMRLKDSFFDSPVIKVLEGFPDGYLYTNILLKLYLASLHDNGKLMLTENVPYTPAMLAGVVRHQIGTVERALKIFRQLGLIEIMESGAIYMLDIQNHIGKSSTNADRQREYDRRIALEKISSRNLVEICKKSSTQEICKKSSPEIEIDIEKDIDIDRKLEINKDGDIIPDDLSIQRVLDMFNESCCHAPVAKFTKDRAKRIAEALIWYNLDEIGQAFDEAELEYQTAEITDISFDRLIDTLTLDRLIRKACDRETVL